MKNKIKLSIALEQNLDFADWQIEVLSQLFKSNQINLLSIIYLKPSVKENNKINNIFSNILKRLIFFIERKYSYITRIKDLKYVNKKISRIKTFNIDNFKRNYFNDSDITEIKKEKLDLILNLSDQIIVSDINCSSKYGTLGYISGGISQRSNPIGFWSSFKEGDISKNFIYIMNNNNYINLLETGFYQNRKYWLLNKEYLNEKLISLILKNVRLIFWYKKISPISKINISKIKFKEPNFFSLANYIFQKYLMFLFGLLKPKKNIEKWTLNISKKKNHLLKNYKKIKPPPPPNFYWADPFLYKYKKRDYLFFENFNIKTKKGKISVGELKKDTLININDILKLDYHMSYPFVFNFKKNIFLIPETSDQKRIEIWKSISFPYKWKLYKILFENENHADVTLLKNKKNIWLFSNKSVDKFNDHLSELYIYKIVDNNFNKILPHKHNPVICDTRRARNAGNFYFEKNKIIRPSQINLKNIYGYGLNLNKIKKLSINKYVEENFLKIIPKKKSSFIGIHHLTSVKNKFVFDIKK